MHQQLIHSLVIIKEPNFLKLPDDVVPIIRVTIPEEELTEMKVVANKGYCLYLPDEEISLNNLKGLSEVKVIDDNMALVSALNYNAFEQAKFETKNGTMTFEINGYVLYKKNIYI